MRCRRARVGLVVAIAALVCFAAACSGRDRSDPTTFTTPPISSTTTTAVPSTTTTTSPPPPRADLAGLSPGFGITALPQADFDATFDAIAATHARWLRVDFDWSVIQRHGASSYDWSRTDRIVAAARARHLSVDALASYTPAWARPSGTPDKNPPIDPDDFARFVSAAAQRYAPTGVTTWEIWNEPNVSTFWYPRPNPQEYTALLVRASAAIKSVEPNATVITGGLSPAADSSNGSEISALTFLDAIYAAGGGRAFDAVALHPYSFPNLPDFAADYNTFLATPALHQVMVDHGDALKKIWGTEVGAPTEGGGGAVSESVQAEIVTQAYQRWTEWSYTGPLIWFAYEDAGSSPFDRDDHFGLVDTDGRPKPALAAFDQAVRTLLARQPAP
ncbi:MAG TPA: cellulase family glycosylhydrolase [Acidimicrobiia bacterium]|nr:cellulase family glycosylhydrolase [Acidimicrobiia bacterium]